MHLKVIKWKLDLNNLLILNAGSILLAIEQYFRNCASGGQAKIRTTFECWYEHPIKLISKKKY